MSDTLLARLRGVVRLVPMLSLLGLAAAWLAVPLLRPEEANAKQASLYLEVTTFAVLAFLGLHLAARLLSIGFPFAGPRAYRLPLLALVAAEAAVMVHLVATATAEGVKEMHDGWLFGQIGLELAGSGTFTVDGAPSHHSPPAYPVFLSLFFVASPTFAAQQAAILLAFFLSMAVVFESTRRLYGSDWGLLAVSLAFSVPSFLFPTSRNYGEPFVMIAFTVALFGVMRSLEPGGRRWIVLAGAGAGLLYLSKSALGLFFFLAVAMVLVWRGWYAGRAMLRDRWYAAASLTALAFMLPWMLRNIVLFWDGTASGLVSAWQTSAWFAEMWEYSIIGHPDRVIAALPTVAALAALFVAPFAFAMYAPLRRSLSLLRREDVGALWMAIVIPIVVTVMISTVIYVQEITWVWHYELMNPRSFYHQSRYLIIVIVPIVWLAALTSRLKHPPGEVVERDDRREAGGRAVPGPPEEVAPP